MSIPISFSGEILDNILNVHVFKGSKHPLFVVYLLVYFLLCVMLAILDKDVQFTIFDRRIDNDWIGGACDLRLIIILFSLKQLANAHFMLKLELDTQSNCKSQVAIWNRRHPCYLGMSYFFR